MVQPYIANIESYHYLHRVIQWDYSIDKYVRATIPTVIAGYQLSGVITLIAILILISMTRSFSEKLRFISQRQAMLKELKIMQKTHQSQDQKDKIAAIESKLEQPNFYSGKKHQELLKEFSSIKKELEKIGRDLAFLSIDVVDSSGIKQDEDPSIVQIDFIEYRNYVEAKFKDHGLIKAAWTPDGVMGCFNTIEDAVQTAQDILNGLEYFNRNVKSIKKEFVIRCGINSGRVYYDDSIPLEQFSDRVIELGMAKSTAYYFSSQTND